MSSSNLTEKLDTGEPISPGDWQKYLIDAHARAPSMTPLAFSDGRTEDGLNSYSLLVRSAPRLQSANLSIVDLASGDGHLEKYITPTLSGGSTVVGVDISEAELKVARMNNSSSQVKFVLARADTLPIESQSVDLMFCHMSLMLFNPVENVIKEISRVLKPAGEFLAVIPNLNASRGLYRDVQLALSSAVHSKFQKFNKVSLGDPAVNDRPVLKDLFRRYGLTLSSTKDFELEFSFNSSQLNTFMQNMYSYNFLSTKEKSELQSEWEKKLMSYANANGVAPLCYPMTLLVFEAKQ